MPGTDSARTPALAEGLPYPLAASVFLVQVAVGIVLFSVFQEFVPDRLGASSAWSGYLLSAYGGARFLFEGQTGAVSDRIERKLSLLGGFALMLPALVLMAVYRDLYAYLALAALLGVASSFLWPASYAIAADLYPSERRGRVIGLLNLGQLLGFGVGALVGAFLVESAPTALFGVAIGAVVGASVAALVGVPSYRADGLFRRVPARPRAPLRSILSRRLMAFGGIVIMVSTAVSMLVPVIRPYGDEQLGVSFATLTVALIPAIVVGAATYVPAGHIADRFGRMAPLIVGEALLVIGLLSIAETTTLALAGAFAVVVFVGNVLTVPAWNAAIMDLAPESHRGTIIGFSVALSGLGLAVGPSLGGTLVSALGAPGTFRVAAALCALTLVAIVVYGRAYRGTPRGGAAGAPGERS